MEGFRLVLKRLIELSTDGLAVADLTFAGVLVWFVCQPCVTIHEVGYYSVARVCGRKSGQIWPKPEPG